MQVKKFLKPKTQGGATIVRNFGYPSTSEQSPLSVLKAISINTKNLEAENIETTVIQASITNSTYGNISEINGSSLSYDTGKINDLETENIKAKTLDVYDTANIYNLINDYLQSKEITTDYLTVNKSAHFFELIIDKMRSVQGTQINTAANCIADYVEAYYNGNKVALNSQNVDYYRVYWKNSDENGRDITNYWLVNDQAICQSFNIKPGTSYATNNKYYWRLVTDTNNEDGNSEMYVNLNEKYEGDDKVSSTEKTYNIHFDNGFTFEIEAPAPVEGQEVDIESFTNFKVESVIVGQYNEYTSVWTPTNVNGGLKIYNNDNNFINGTFSFTTEYPTKLNIAIVYEDGTIWYFKAETYEDSYAIATDSSTPISYFLITTDVIETWQSCNWIDLSNTIKDTQSSQNPNEISEVPTIGDNICQLGYRYNLLPGFIDSKAWRDAHETEVARASAIIIAAYNTPDPDVKPPSYAQYQNIITFDLSSNRGSYFDATGAYFKGNLVSESGTLIDITDQGFTADVEYYQIISSQSPILRPSGDTNYVDIRVLHVVDGIGGLMTKAELDDWYITVNNSNPIYRDSIKDNPGCFTIQITHSSPDSANINLYNPSGVLKDNIVISVINLDDVKDGVDGDYYEFIYYKDFDTVDVTREDLPANIQKKFIEYTNAQKNGWSGTTPVPQDDEYVWMSNRQITHDVLPYDPSVITSPIIIANKESIVLESDPNSTITATLKVNGHLLTENVIVTLTDANSVFSISSNSLDYEAVNANGVILTITFAPSVAGNYTANIALSGSGAETVNIPLLADASTGDLASDNYLNVKKNASISTVGWDQTKVNLIYKYTEYPDYGEAWLTMPVYGAFSAIHENYTQNWIDTNVTFDTSTSITTGGWTPISDDIFLGSDTYFTTTTAKSVGAEALLSSTGSNVSFVVTNVTSVKLYGHNRSWTGTASHPMSITVYECTVSGGTVTPDSTYTFMTSNSGKDIDIILNIDGLSYDKVYKIVVAEERGTMYEVAFCTPITKDAQNQNQYTQIAVYNNWSTPIRITGEHGEKGVDGNGVEYIYCRTTNNNPPTIIQSYLDLNDPSIPSSIVQYEIIPGEPGYDTDENLIARWWDTDNTGYARFQNDFIPPSKKSSQMLLSEWTSEPQGVNDTYIYEWVAVREYDGSAEDIHGNIGDWSRFSEPVVWAKYGKDGINGVDGINGTNGIDGKDGEYWMLVPLVNDFSVRINSSNNYESITGRLNMDLAFGIIHVKGTSAGWISAAEMADYSMNLVTDNTTTDGQRNVLSNIQYTNQSVTINGTTIAVLTYVNTNYLTYTANAQSGDYTDYYYLHKNNLIDRMPTKVTAELVKSGVGKIYAYTQDLIFKPDHIFSVTEDALNSVYQGLSGNIGGSYTSGFSSIKQQWDSINLSVNNIDKINNGEFPVNNDYEQYAYWKGNNSAAPSKPVGDVAQTGNVNNQWTTYNVEPDNANKYVFCSRRTKPTDSNTHATDQWSVWSNPILFQVYGSGRGVVNNAALNIAADQISARVTTDIDGELQSTGIDITNGTITLDANNTIIDGDLDLKGNFVSEDAVHMNKIIADVYNGGFTVWGADSYDHRDPSMPAPGAQYTKMAEIYSDYELDGNHKQGTMTIYGTSNSGDETTIAGNHISITTGNGGLPDSNVSIGTNGVSTDNYDIGWDQINNSANYNKLNVSFMNHSPYYAALDESVIIVTGDPGSDFQLILPAPSTAMGKQVYIKNQTNRNGTFTCVDSTQSNPLIMDHEDTDLDASRNLQRDSTMLICDGTYWIIFSYQY